MTNTPAKAGFYMPAEWEKHEGTWLQWPQDRVYTGYELKLEKTWLTMVDALHKRENVHLIVADERQRDHVASQLKYFGIGLENVHLYIIPTNDVWARDNGPIFVVNQDGDVAITNWEFNGWGNRFEHQREQFPDRDVIGIDAVALIEHGGAIGCVTQPQPLGHVKQTGIWE